ncbi:CaiB/BaiF CoA transferase family protein [Saccharomonospora glauca]|uniref:Putative acyl-CoA transferase/carnitine dehydratase n=1 Tax=Saccharomonospora glauca K62 TaxID=928724 RepID=I1D2H4_9PSEU|nr:CaiB/BaiF CoA-transferase family protein [Saccharomonospora glauca]EIE99148.1 putative acyl-CoA transferase/carnitine dehydratase [Saccharomonospora glauca K62]
MPGPLNDLRVVELAGLGPAPHAAMLLADLGADVVRIERPGGNGPDLLGGLPDHLLRGRRTIVTDLKTPEGRARVLELVERADVLIEGFRPGVAERLGVGPEDCHRRNARLVYGRVTGWGRSGPLSDRAGHDINYLSLTGALHAVGTRDRPVAPLNLIGDFGGGSLFLLAGILAALWERERSGLGQVVDATMTDGVGLLMHMIWTLHGSGVWSDERASNLLDGGAPFYDTYACSDGRWVAVGAIEPQFYRALLDGLDLAGEELPDQYDRAGWPVLRARIAGVFATKPRDHWAEVFTGTDACVTPVLSLEEVADHPHNRARQRFFTRDGVRQPKPSPEFSRTSPDLPSPPPSRPTEYGAVLRDWEA